MLSPVASIPTCASPLLKMKLSLLAQWLERSVEALGRGLAKPCLIKEFNLAKTNTPPCHGYHNFFRTELQIDEP